MTNQKRDDRRDQPGLHAWTTPPLESAEAVDELDGALHGLALAVGALRRFAGPTEAVGELAGLVQSLVNEIRALTPEQRRQAAQHLRDGMDLRSAVLVPVLLRDGAGQ